jgi:decaprenylphospho-beta-D-erythro-pentofuranosid-2-ulose 2-reductase
MPRPVLLRRVLPRRVLIVGATSAIAQEIARLYAQRGARLFLIGRDPGKLGALVESLGPAVVGTRIADLTHTAHSGGLIDAAWQALGGLDVACIAHGLLGDQRATERDFAQAELVIDTNFVSVTALLIPLANRFEEARGGSIAVLSSVAGDRGRPRNYTYGAAKAGLNVYLEGLRTRLGKVGVRVNTFKLGPVDTPMTAGHRKHVLFSKPADVAARVVTAIDRGLTVVYVPWYWRPIMFAVRSLPELVIGRIGFLAGR